jgi:hypothetical protein
MNKKIIGETLTKKGITHMKKITFLLILILLLSLALSACGGSNASDDAASVEVSGTPMPGGGLSDSMRLLLGILSLADSDTPLSADQASVLLPLWKAVRSLGESDTAAQAEIDAVYTQIRGTLTDEQLEAIDAMSLDGQSMASLAEELGIDSVFGGGMRGTASPELQATRQALLESGELPRFEEGAAPPEGFRPPEGVVPGSGGGFGGGMGGGRMFGDGSGLTQEQMATAQASGAVNLPGLRNTISGPWLEALISQLESIAAGE